MFVIFNYEKLEERIDAMYGNQQTFGNQMCMARGTINSRLRGINEFSISEITKAAHLLNIQPDEIPEYFFDGSLIREEAVNMTVKEAAQLMGKSDQFG